MLLSPICNIAVAYVFIAVTTSNAANFSPKEASFEWKPYIASVAKILSASWRDFAFFDDYKKDRVLLYFVLRDFLVLWVSFQVYRTYNRERAVQRASYLLPNSWDCYPYISCWHSFESVWFFKFYCSCQYHKNAYNKTGYFLKIENADFDNNALYKNHRKIFPSTIRLIVIKLASLVVVKMIWSLKMCTHTPSQSILIWNKYLEKLLRSIRGSGYYAFSASQNILPPTDAKRNSVFIVDDMTCDNQDVVREYFSMGRYNHINSFYLT